MDLMVFQREREDQSSLTDYKGGGVYKKVTASKGRS